MEIQLVTLIYTRYSVLFFYPRESQVLFCWQIDKCVTANSCSIHNCIHELNMNGQLKCLHWLCIIIHVRFIYSRLHNAYVYICSLVYIQLNYTLNWKVMRQNRTFEKIVFIIVYYLYTHICKLVLKIFFLTWFQNNWSCVDRQAEKINGF